jgi:hypothetical protein
MRVSFLLYDLLTPLVLLPSWSVMDPVFWSLLWVSAPGPFRLSDVLIAPQMVHNLLSIHQFTVDNSCSVEFDTSGLSVKDLATERPLLRCDSTGPLYTLRLPISATSTSPSSSSSASLVVTPSSTTWHRRLVHPGEMFWLRLVVVEISLVLGLLLRTSVRHDSLVVMFGFLFLLLLHMLCMFLILSTVMCGLLLYSAFLVISIIW